MSSVAPLLAGAVAAGAVAAAGSAVRLHPSQGRRLVEPVHRHANPVDRLTVAVFTAIGHPVPRPAARRRLRRWAAGAILAAAVAPPAAVPVAVAGLMWGRRQGHRARRVQERAVASALPDAVDLLALCARAGMALPIAHGTVAARLPPPVGPALVVADREAAAGRSRADALADALTPLGARAASLAHVLAEHLRYGVPLVPALDRLGSELRAARRRQAEEDARRVPVRLLGPLVACVLPAFALLTVVPLLAASLRALPT